MPDIDHPTLLPGTALTADQVLPDVPLTDAATGAPWRPSQLRQRSALVLAFVHTGCGLCDDLVRGLAERAEDIRWADAQVRVVRDGPADEPADEPFPVLLDPGGEARARLLGADGALPTVLVADRYTAVAESYPLPGHDGADPREIVATLCHLAIECSECSV